MNRILKTNYHTHTDFCDGKDSAEIMAAAAFEKHFDILGFSGHSMYPFASGWHIAPREHEAYVSEIARLKDKYRGQMQILCGFEADYVPGLSIPRMDTYTRFHPQYLIGSVHYIVTEKGWFCVDDTAENVHNGIETLFMGNAKEAVCTYFALQREMLRKGNFTIWGHPDVIRKRNGVLHFFDESESWYRTELLATAEEARHAGIIAEINTGAISRHCMDDVYPSAEFLKILRDNDVPIVISSDAHAAGDIDCAFDRAALAAKKAGYTETVYIDEGLTKSQALHI
jgi:histidinol-phosphatase (PHP family)